ncbi:hypothetical protein IFM89_029568 [Coptis chinensis]|uniref:Pentatricopeptide repeat-containing protein n=1 Tax=Coptis chinensis TaxID=261450 RepID=A0A835H1B8_9MAGN|nr:hypothetical protein IFM89_029568 [Coptis chinensis]
MLQLNTVTPFSINFKPTQFHLQNSPFTRISCISTRPKRKAGVKIDKSETEELVKTLLRNFNDKKPLVNVLDKYSGGCKTAGTFADNGVYSKLISVMGKKGQIRMAMWLFSEMRNSGCRRIHLSTIHSFPLICIPEINPRL